MSENKSNRRVNLKFFNRMLLCGAVFACTGTAAHANGAGPGGVDLLHVPISWCPVIGSPAQASPNLAGDTNTDALLWRRHERPTDNIFINTVGITFRSSINNAWTILDFPQLTDPNTALATVGDMRGEDVNAFGAEFNALVNGCDAAYAAPALNRANIGVTAVNAGLFHDAAGTYVGVIGWGGCTRPAGAQTTCATPYDGRIVVVDNIYLHPASPNRLLPGTNLQFTLTDPFDQLVGHELGHALGLGHSNGATLLMNPGPVDNNGDGQSDNVALNATQGPVTRASGLIVPGLEIDPPMVVNPGDFIADRIMDAKDEGKTPSFQDIASVRLSFDKKLNRIFISNQLSGIHAEKGAPGSVHWIVLDTDGDAGGAKAGQVQDLGLKSDTIENADFVIRVDVRYPETKVTGWRWDGIQFDQHPRVFAELQTLIMHPHLVNVPGLKTPDIGDARIYDTVVASLPAKLVGVKVGSPVKIDVVVQDLEGVELDRLAGGRRDNVFVLENPDFPHCYVLKDGKAGETVPVLVEGLLPQAPIHALVGPDEVAKAETDSRGNVELELPIPEKARDGAHLVTIGVDDTALTADCVVQVGERKIDEGNEKGRQPQFRDELLRRHLDLLKESLDAIREMNKG